MPGPLFLFPSPRGPRFKQPKLYSIWQENKEPALAKFTSLKKKKKPLAIPKPGLPYLILNSLETHSEKE